VWTAERLLPRVYAGIPVQAVSESTADDLVARGLARGRISVIHNGVDLERFRPDPRVPKFEAPAFLYLGRLKRYKGLEGILDVVAEIVGQGEAVYWIVAGKGDHERVLRKRVRTMRLRTVVELRGFVSEEEKIELLRRAWAVLYPSPKEGWGITNLEAAACGTPVIASDSPGLRDSVRPGVSGLLVPHGDRDAWVRAILRLVWEPGLRERLSRGAREFAQGFSWDRAADETEAHLHRVLENRSAPPEKAAP
ncbi:MAG: glycosyltransferase family 4 protein, partial [Gemmatimonadota bacterium]